jgi:hypothetical protein
VAVRHGGNGGTGSAGAGGANPIGAAASTIATNAILARICCTPLLVAYYSFLTVSGMVITVC